MAKTVKKLPKGTRFAGEGLFGDVYFNKRLFKTFVKKPFSNVYTVNTPSPEFFGKKPKQKVRRK